MRICIPCSVSSVNREVVELELDMADTERMRVSSHEKLHELLLVEKMQTVYF